MEVVRLERAEEFLEYLRPSNYRWWNGMTGTRSHIFRGHADASWKLRPLGWRPLSHNPQLSSLYRAVSWHVDKRWAAAERPFEEQANFWRLALAEAVIQFASLGRSVGLEIPWEVPTSICLSPRNIVPHIDPSLLALAQHHGIPTQLLDWSEDPFTAAFFALGEQDATTDLCVWALAIKGLEEGPNTHVSLKRLPNIGNTNLRAQSGIFLAYAQGSHLNAYFDGEWPSFENDDEIRKTLIQVCLPASQRPTLQHLLQRENRSKAHLMPSWDNVAASLRDEWIADPLWSGPSPL